MEYVIYIIFIAIVIRVAIYALDVYNNGGK